MKSTTYSSRKRIILNQKATQPEQFQSLRYGQHFGFIYRFRSNGIKEPFRRVRHQFGENVPDSSQEHPANGDNGFPVTAASFDTAITFRKLRKIFETDHRISDLNEKWLDVGTGTGNTR